MTIGKGRQRLLLLSSSSSYSASISARGVCALESSSYEKVPVRYRPNAARLKVKHYVSVHLAQILEGVACDSVARLDIDKRVI